jgi:hypothetical protein
MPSALATPAFGTAARRPKVEVAAKGNNGTGSQPSSTRGQITQAAYFLLDRGVFGPGGNARQASRPDGQADGKLRDCAYRADRGGFPGKSSVATAKGEVSLIGQNPWVHRLMIYLSSESR